MDEKENPLELDLEDILKEFAQDPADPEPEENVLIWDGSIPEKEQQPATKKRDTVPLNEITEVVKKLEETPVTEDTVRFTPASDETVRFTPASDDTVRFTPVEEQEEDYAPPVVSQEETVEPFSQEWEPEYEQPIGEYIPPEPIVFRPRSRLRELKRKLVEGPERRYYELAEQGVGKLQVAIFLNLLVTVMAVATTAMYGLDLVRPDRIRLMVFSQFFALLLSGLLGSYQLMDGFGALLHKRFTLNTLLLFSFVACIADAVICLGQERMPCCAAFSLSMTMSLWSAYQKRRTEISQMDTMRKATRLDSLVRCENYYEGRGGILRGEGQVEDFMDTYQRPSGAERTLSIYGLVALFVSLGVGIAAGVMKDPHMGIQAFCASLLVAVPVTGHIMLSRPMALLERRLHKLGTVLCGWQGIKKLSKNAVFPLLDMDLFPAGSAKMNGVKFYGSREPDEIVAYAAALICQEGGSMAPLFSALLESRNGYHYEVGTLREYGNGGVGGEVNGEAVLAGSLSFMQSMGVEMPEGTRVNQAVYVAVDGVLSGVFAISYNKGKASSTGMTTLCAYRGLTPVMVTRDFVLTENFLRSKFGVNTRRIAFPDPQTREQLAQTIPGEEAEALALMTQESLAGKAYAVTGARALRSASILGVVIHMLGGILGLLIMIALTLVNADHLLTGINILLYQLIWMVPGMLITEWTRSV